MVGNFHDWSYTKKKTMVGLEESEENAANNSRGEHGANGNGTVMSCRSKTQIILLTKRGERERKTRKER